MFETVIPMLPLLVEVVMDPDIVAEMYDEGHQVVDVRIARAAGDLLESSVHLDAVVLRPCDGDSVTVPVDQTVDIVDGIALVTDAEVEVCGVMLNWGSEMELRGFGMAGAFQLTARERRTPIRIREEQGRAFVNRWRVDAGVVPDRRNPAVLVEVLRPDVEED